MRYVPHKSAIWVLSPPGLHRSPPSTIEPNEFATGKNVKLQKKVSAIKKKKSFAQIIIVINISNRLVPLNLTSNRELRRATVDLTWVGSI